MPYAQTPIRASLDIERHQLPCTALPAGVQPGRRGSGTGERLSPPSAGVRSRRTSSADMSDETASSAASEEMAGAHAHARRHRGGRSRPSIDGGAHTTTPPGKSARPAGPATPASSGRPVASKAMAIPPAKRTPGASPSPSPAGSASRRSTFNVLAAEFKPAAAVAASAPATNGVSMQRKRSCSDLLAAAAVSMKGGSTSLVSAMQGLAC